MKYKITSFIILAVQLGILVSCKSDFNKYDTDKINFINNDKVFTLKPKNISKKTDYQISISLPMPICTNDSTVIFFDYTDTKVKLLNNNGTFEEFNPFGEGDNILGGAYFRGLGFSFIKDELIIGYNEGIKKYNLLSKRFGDNIDKFNDCANFSKIFSEIFLLKTKEDELVISQNGIPCINMPRDGKSFKKKEFENIKFLRIKSSRNKAVNYTFEISPGNEILSQNKLYVKTYPLVSLNKENNKFYAIINPTNKLYEYNLEQNSMDFKTTNVWNLNLPYTNLPVEYTLNKGENFRLFSDDNRKFNMEFKEIKAVKDYVVISYRPSKSTDIKNMEEAKFANHYFLAILDLKNEKSKVFSLNYHEIVYLGCLNNGDILLYLVEDSENSKQLISTIGRINIEELFKKSFL